MVQLAQRKLALVLVLAQVKGGLWVDRGRLGARGRRLRVVVLRSHGVSGAAVCGSASCQQSAQHSDPALNRAPHPLLCSSSPLGTPTSSSTLFCLNSVTRPLAVR